jgi:hypothetical protein
MQTPFYSHFFSCLYNESQPAGNIGRGTHYSIFRCVEWLNVTRKPLNFPEIHDFAIIWDEDHDTRVIDAVEAIYMAGLLSPVQFIGERKGYLTIIIASIFWGDDGKNYDDYIKKIEAICSDLKHGDSWNIEIGMFDKAEHWHQTETKGIIADSEYKVSLYLRNIDSLWNLGTKKYHQPKSSDGQIPPWPITPKPTLL